MKICRHRLIHDNNDSNNILNLMNKASIDIGNTWDQRSQYNLPSQEQGNTSLSDNETYTYEQENSEIVLSESKLNDLREAEKYVEHCYNIAVEKRSEMFLINLEKYERVVRLKLLIDLFYRFSSIAKVVPVYEESYLKLMDNPSLYNWRSIIPITKIDPKDYVYAIATHNNYEICPCELGPMNILKRYPNNPDFYPI